MAMMVATVSGRGKLDPAARRKLKRSQPQRQKAFAEMNHRERNNIITTAMHDAVDPTMSVEEQKAALRFARLKAMGHV